MRPGQGPTLHSHVRTRETFTCLTGRFRVYWGLEGEDEAILEPFDTVSIPAGTYRGFTNIGDEDAYMLVLITGGVHDMGDIVFPASTAAQLAAFGPDVVREFEAFGLRFGP